jgi:alpha-beta hydrolase superfamily lysophospholipase
MSLRATINQVTIAGSHASKPSMSHPAKAASPAPAPRGRAEPRYFRSGDSRLFAWLHTPAAPRSDIGVVICKPFGYESICSHRSVRAFAEALCALGVPALRFDYAGTGDSSDVDENDDQVRYWVRDVLAAVDELRRTAKVERVCLLGIRLGALLAALAAADSDLIDALILIGPVISGRRYVRELRMTQLAGIALSGGSEPGSESSSGSDTSAGKALEAGGFLLSAATLKALSSLDLQARPAPTVRSMLILDGDKLPAAKRWAESLAHTSAALQYLNLPGLIEMTMTAPQFAVVPDAMIKATTEWLTGLPTPAAPASSPAAASSLIANPVAPNALDASCAPDAGPGSAEAAILELGGAACDPRISERPVCIPSDLDLFAILTEPSPDEKRRRAVILLNPGADFHIGASRMYVSLARRWARSGYFVLRLDLGGIGDSGTRLGRRSDEVFPDEAIADINRAIEFVRARYAISDIALAGLCSGAYHALRAAVAGADVNRILMVNPQNYFWKKGMTLEQVQLVEVVHNPGVYRQRLFSGKAWARILTGQTDVVRIGAIYLQRLHLAAATMTRSVGRLLGVRLSDDLGLELQHIVSKGIRVTFLFAQGEPGLDLLRLQAGSMLSRLGDHCRVRIVDRGDHIFSRREPRRIMESALSEELFAASGDANAAAEDRASLDLEQASAK